MLRLPTAGLACIALDIDEWSHLRPACGLLHGSSSPRIVSPFLHANRLGGGTMG